MQEAEPGASHSAAAPAGGAPEAHTPEAPINPLKLEPQLAIYTLLVFVGLLLVLKKYAWGPLLTALHNREEHLEHVLLETEKARNQSEALLADHRKQMARAADEVRTLLEKGRQEAQSAAEQIMKTAQSEAESSRQRAQREIATARDQALAEIWQKTADMSVLVAGRVLAKELSGEEQRRLLDRAIAELPAAKGANGQGGKQA
jgi:F-type H+-transporting ATPase subunit b